MTNANDANANPGEIDTNKIAVPAATVVLLRDGDAGPEVLLARRNSKIYFAGGAWVFPGGRIDVDDHGENYVGELFDEADPNFIDVARRACVREAAEEAGAKISVDDLVWMSHWTPPMEAPRRVSTFFFIAPAPTHALQADMGEIHELAWMRPSEAMARRNADEIELIPPTFITLAILNAFASTQAALDFFRQNSPEFFVTKFAGLDSFALALYEGDAGYQSGDPTLEGPRHRLWMGKSEWRYERDDLVRFR